MKHHPSGMPSTPRKRVKKPGKKKEREKQELKTIEETFPNITKDTLEQLNNFYKMGLSANLTANQPKMPGRQTTQRVFRYFDNELLDAYDMDANNRQKLAKQKNKEGT